MLGAINSKKCKFVGLFAFLPMLDLSNHIKRLLLVHDCVILPGFGGFVANYASATHDESTHTFSPPSKQLLFNSSLSNNDGLLVGEISQELGIPYAEADAMVRQCIDEAWMKLENGESLEMEGIGIFRLTDDQTLTFTPKLTANLLTDSCGMSSFRFPPLSYQTKNEQVINNDNIRKMPTIEPQKVLLYAAALLPIAVLIGLIPFHNRSQQQDAGVMPVPVAFEDTVTASSSVDYAINASTNKRAALFYNETPQQQTQPHVDASLSNGTYYIIGASFKERANAEKHAKLYAKEGFKSEVVESGSLYRVSLAVYTDKVKALHELRRIRANERYSNAWIYTKAE